MSKHLKLSEPAMYQIRVKGVLDPRWATWFEGLVVTAEGDETLITGSVSDQSALHGLISKIRDLGLPLISVSRIDS